MKCIQSSKKSFQLFCLKFTESKSFRKREIFEEYLKKKVFMDEDYMLLYKTPLRKKKAELYNKSDKLPSLMFISKKNNYIFWVEFMFRSKLNLNGKLEVLEYYKINRNQNLIEPVIYAIGFQGKPSKPNELFLVPQKDIHPNLHLKQARKYLLPF